MNLRAAEEGRARLTGDKKSRTTLRSADRTRHSSCLTLPIAVWCAAPFLNISLRPLSLLPASLFFFASLRRGLGEVAALLRSEAFPA